MTKVFQHSEVCYKENNTLLVPSEITLFAAKTGVKALGKCLSYVQEQGNPGQAVLHWGLSEQVIEARSSDRLLLDTQSRLCLWGCDRVQVSRFGNCLHVHTDTQSNGSVLVRRWTLARSQKRTGLQKSFPSPAKLQIFHEVHMASDSTALAKPAQPLSSRAVKSLDSALSWQCVEDTWGRKETKLALFRLTLAPHCWQQSRFGVWSFFHWIPQGIFLLASVGAVISHCICQCRLPVEDKLELLSAVCNERSFFPSLLLSLKSIFRP